MSDSPTAMIDHSRRSVSVVRRLMPSIMAIHAGQHPQPASSIAELSAGGIVSGSHLDPLVTTLLEVMTNPSLVITVEVIAQQRTRLATYWGTPRRAVIGLTDDRRRFDLVQIEPSLLPFHLAQSTGITPRPDPPLSGRFSLSASTFEFAENSIASDPSGTKRALLGDGVPQRWADRLMTALALRNCVWTAQSAWLGRGAPRSESSLSVLDAGFAGYWELAASGGRVTVSTTTFDAVLTRLADLLPVVGGS